MALNLGNLITTLGGQYINARWGNNLQQNTYSMDDWRRWLGLDGDPGTGTTVPTVPPGGANCSTRGLVYDPEKGRWIKRRRRRRRRLVTPTDIKDIAALKAIIGNGQALNSAVIKAVN